MSDMVKMTVYITDRSKRPEFGKVRSAVFPGTKPCSTMVEVKGLAQPGLLVEVDVVAIKRGARMITGIDAIRSWRTDGSPAGRPSRPAPRAARQGAESVDADAFHLTRALFP